MKDKKFTKLKGKNKNRKSTKLQEHFNLTLEWQKVMLYFGLYFYIWWFGEALQDKIIAIDCRIDDPWFKVCLLWPMAEKLPKPT